MSIYFNTTPLIKWNNAKCIEYFGTKYNIELVDPNVTGKWLISAKLKHYRQIFGKSTGEKMYIIVHDRIEREEDVIKTPISPLGDSPIGSPIISNWTKVSPIQQCVSPIQQCVSPIQQCVSPIQQQCMSNLDLNKPYDIKESDDLSKIHFDMLKSKSLTLVSEFIKNKLLLFVCNNPPLLWQNEHLHIFLKEFLGLEYVNGSSLPDVDDFIFMTSDEIEVYFPNKGSIIKATLLSRFVNPDIKKIRNSKG